MKTNKKGASPKNQRITEKQVQKARANYRALTLALERQNRPAKARQDALIALENEMVAACKVGVLRTELENTFFNVLKEIYPS